MTERPILFSGPMVRAILEGRKSQTRRVVTDHTSQGNWKASELDLARAWVDPGPSPAGNRGPYLKALPTLDALRAHEWPESEFGHVIDRLYPRWFPGDRLWVRETWAADFLWPMEDGGERREWSEMPPANRVPSDDAFVTYRADGLVYGCDDTGVDDQPCADSDDGTDRSWQWKPSIHMPRWASRTMLEVTGVRVERVQEISEDDAKAEGIVWVTRETEPRSGVFVPCARDNYRDLWDSLNAKRGYSFESDPWVWCISFKRVVA